MFDLLLDELIQVNTSRIVMFILDGLGGIPEYSGGKTELETAFTPNLDDLAFRSSLGMTQPLGPGITVGSGPGHLAMFGYDPLVYEIGRGALEVLGVDFELGPDDIAGRGNFCTLDEHGIITDRRAGRLPTEEAVKLIEILRTIKIDGAEFFIEPIKEHRFAFVLRKPGAKAELNGTDPLKTGVAPYPVIALTPEAQADADLINAFVAQARDLLMDKSPANMIMLRGFEKLPEIPSFSEKYKLKAAAIAVNGMYRGVARLAGMQVLNVNGITIADEFDTLEQAWSAYDFFYFHVKKTDTYGEMGDFKGKVSVIEEFDSLLPRMLALHPDVIIIGGDHSSPSVMQSHSWHPVPLLVHSRFVRSSGIKEFGETACAHGTLGIIPAIHVMPLALANAGRLEKYRA